MITWLYQKGVNYNLFMLKDDEYDDDDVNIQDPTITVKHQKYKTRLYVILLTVCLYILFYINLIKTKPTTVILSDITFDLYNKLYVEHHQTLSCPCSTITIPYENITSNDVIIHPVCSSIFVDPIWIQGLYFAEASQYGVWDFRTAAYSQFEFLSSFCSLSNEVISQTLTDIDHNEFVSLYLLSEEQIRIEIDGKIEYLKNSAASRMITFLNYLRNTSNTHYFVSALNTNFIIETSIASNGFSIFFAHEVHMFDVPYEPNCGGTVLKIDATFSPQSYESIDHSNRYVISPMPNSSTVTGFFAACTPVEAILESTLDCLYEVECLHLLLNYFPNLTTINFNPDDSVLSSEHENISVHEYLDNLFIKNWSKQINYTKYFDLCSPSSCSYSAVERSSVVYAITLFISLYGGLIIILRLIASFSIDMFMKWKFCMKRRNDNSAVEQRINQFKFAQTIKRLNLFKNINDRTEQSIKHQKVVTRVYLILLFGSICTVCLFTSLNSENVTITITNLTMTTYNDLEDQHYSTLRCPCSNKAISYKNFLSLSPRLHQICSSHFVHNHWINILRSRRKHFPLKDWRSQLYLQVQFLSDFCRLANKTIDDAVIRYLSQLFIVSSVMHETEFNKQINASLNQFYQSTTYNFDVMTDVLRLLMQIDQLYVQSARILYGRVNDVNLISEVMADDGDSTRLIKYHFLLNEIQQINSTMSKCVCAINPYCQTPYVVSDPGFNAYKNLVYDVPGSIRRCLAIDSLLSSSLECLYEDYGCFPLLIASFYETLGQENYNPSLTFDFGPLIYNPATTVFPPNITVSSMFKEMMVEQWNPSMSYRSFFESCAPTYCTYSQRMRTENFLGVIIIIISMIGGLILSLRIVTPYLVKIIVGLMKKLKKKRQRTERVHQSYFNRIKTIIQNMIKLLSKTLIELNIFSSSDFESSIDRLTATYNGRWATRLYILLFLSTFTILIFYTMIQPHSVTKTFDQPSFNSSEQLRKIYGNKLKCSCSQIASTYNKFVEIIPEFHPICSSQFVSKEWHMGIINSLTSNFSLYSENDYRRFISAHLQYLQGLCQISKDSVNNAINELLTSLLVTVELLSKENFHHCIETLIEESKSDVPFLVSRFLFMIQTFNHGNAFMTTYGTNFQYVSRISDSYAHTNAMIYDDNCSCGLSSNCTTQANFIEKSTIIPIVGLKMGCLPSESFRLSTLECFYNQSCLDLVHKYTNYQNSSIALSTNLSYFPPNSTINELINHAFTEQWLKNITYSSYYDECFPSVCSYTYIEKFNILYLITLFLSLQGGLTLVLAWICPKIIQNVSKIYHYYRRRRQRTSVYPDNSLSMSSNDFNIQNTNNNADNQTEQNRTFEQRISSPSRRYSKRILIISLLILLIISIIIFSIYYARNVSIKNKTMDRTLNTTITSTTTMMSTSSITTEPLCQDKFQQQISTNISCSEHDENNFQIATGDFNNDNRVDLVYSCRSNQNEEIIVLMNNGNGTFHNSSVLLLSRSDWITHMYVVDFNNDNRSDVFLIHGSNFIILLSTDNETFEYRTELTNKYISSINEVHIADFNNDNQSDVLLIRNTEPKENLIVFLGNDNGAFQTQIMVSSTKISKAINTAVVYDLNNDKILDIVISFTQFEKNVCIIYGRGNGSFSSGIVLFERNMIYAVTLAVTDINNDHYADIVIYDEDSKHFYVLFGSANGAFQRQKPFFTAIISFPYFLFIDDFDNDNQSDIAFLYSLYDFECKIYHYHNNSFKRNEKTVIKSLGGLDTVIVRDINNDNYLDIILGTVNPNKIYVLFGYGNNRFYSHMVYSGEYQLFSSWLAVGDFNNDNFQDIVSANYDTMLIDVFLYKRECSIA
ncbi:unnamed protein product [Adineta steineri]|uniref:Uncharacterized protein n=1 Tax=Adineta steineri TaxID=433720 RepID=A0A819L4F7_9BILA|nr:unnamed protein product [Adineta steineri]CAF3954700.1 unnamed protein product [Adineta steineri]